METENLKPVEDGVKLPYLGEVREKGRLAILY